MKAIEVRWVEIAHGRHFFVWALRVSGYTIGELVVYRDGSVGEHSFCNHESGCFERLDGSPATIEEAKQAVEQALGVVEVSNEESVVNDERIH